MEKFSFFFSNPHICVVFLAIRGGAWADPRSSHVLFDTSAARCRLTHWGSSRCVLQRELLQQNYVSTKVFMHEKGNLFAASYTNNFSVKGQSQQREACEPTCTS